MYIRFSVGDRDPDSQVGQGIFQAAYRLKDRGELESGELEWFEELSDWFKVHLARPTRFAWSSRPDAPRRAISWLKLSATLHLARLRELASLLEHKDLVVEEVHTERPGYIVYEDEHQVVAMPFQRETF